MAVKGAKPKRPRKKAAGAGGPPKASLKVAFKYVREIMQCVNCMFAFPPAHYPAYHISPCSTRGTSGDDRIVRQQVAAVMARQATSGRTARAPQVWACYGRLMWLKRCWSIFDAGLCVIVLYVYSAALGASESGSWSWRTLVCTISSFFSALETLCLFFCMFQPSKVSSMNSTLTFQPYLVSIRVASTDISLPSPHKIRHKSVTS